MRVLAAILMFWGRSSAATFLVTAIAPNPQTDELPVGLGAGFTILIIGIALNKRSSQNSDFKLTHYRISPAVQLGGAPSSRPRTANFWTAGRAARALNDLGLVSIPWAPGSQCSQFPWLELTYALFSV